MTLYNQQQTCYQCVNNSFNCHLNSQQQMKPNPLQLIQHPSSSYTIHNFSISTHNTAYLPPSGGDPSTIGVLDRDEPLGTLPGIYS